MSVSSMPGMPSSAAVRLWTIGIHCVEWGVKDHGVGSSAGCHCGCAVLGLLRGSEDCTHDEERTVLGDSGEPGVGVGVKEEEDTRGAAMECKDSGNLCSMYKLSKHQFYCSRIRVRPARQTHAVL